MFISDQETATDMLQYEAIAKTVVKLIEKSPGVPITIGVHGDWGAGKSSVLKRRNLPWKGRMVSCASGSTAGHSRGSRTRRPWPSRRSSRS